MKTNKNSNECTKEKVQSQIDNFIEDFSKDHPEKGFWDCVLEMSDELGLDIDD